MTRKYQTIYEFLTTPFRGTNNVQKLTEYDSKYRAFVAANKISVSAVTEIEKSVYIHVKVPSESQKNENYFYDVVIRFFTEDEMIASQSSLSPYYIQFFSNSPSFMYQYAYLYNKEGFLIEALYDKLDADYIDTPPEKTNAKMTISFDKSIYFACRYLQDNKFRYLTKTSGMFMLKKKSSTAFFKEISDFKSVKFDQAVITEERKLRKALEKHSGKDDKIKKSKSSNTSKNSIHSIHIVQKVTGKKPIAKKKASKSTRRPKL